MKLGGNDTFRNGLTVRVDWLSFTLKDSVDPCDAFDLLGYSITEFHALPSGRFGYKSAYACVANDGLAVLFNGNDGMGVHVDVSGSAVDDVLSHYHEKRSVSTPFGDVAYEADDIASTVLSDLLKEICLCGKLTRLDLAIDDMGAEYFTMDEIQNMCQMGMCVSRFRSFRPDMEIAFTGPVLGHTIYFGKRESACMIRAYDKKLEQNAKLQKSNQPLIENEWVRWELELKDERANSAAKLLVSGMLLGEVTIGILSNYIRFVNLDNTRRSRCSTLEKWERFISGVVRLKLFQRPEPKTIADKKAWIWNQVAKSLATVVKADGGDLEFLYRVITHGSEKMNKIDYDMIDAHIAYLERVEMGA